LGRNGNNAGSTGGRHRKAAVLACRWRGCAVCGAEGDDVKYTPDDHAVIARCVERQPDLFIRGQHEGYYIHSDISALIELIARLSNEVLSPHEARLILASMGYGDGSIKPGLYTAEQKLDVLDKLRTCAAEDGEK